MQAAGIRVPADVAVVGFDDMHLSALLAPPLTTVRQPMRLLGERARSRLLQRIADPILPPQAECLPTELIIRGATLTARYATGADIGEIAWGHARDERPGSHPSSSPSSRDRATAWLREEAPSLW